MKNKIQTIAKYDGWLLDYIVNDEVLYDYLLDLNKIHKVACDVIEQLAIHLADMNPSKKANEIKFAIKCIEVACTKRPVNGEYVELIETTADGIDLINSLK